MLFYDLVSVSIVGYICFPFLKFIESKETLYLVLGISILVVDYSTKAIKYFTKNIHDIFKRPLGAYDCDIFCRNKLREGDPGFPSGHVTTMAFFTTFVYLQTKNMPFTYFNIIWTLLVSLSRYKKKCHNEFQITAGIMYGCGCAFLLNNLLKTRKGT